MKRLILTSVIVLFMIFRPGPVRAETRVYVSVSVGGAAVIGAGILYWGFSYTSQVSEHKPSDENSGRLSPTAPASEPNSPRTVHIMPQLIPKPVTTQEPAAADAIFVSAGPFASSSVELPLLVIRW